MAGPTLPAIATRLHVRESDLGIVFTANFLTASLGIAVSGRAFDALGPRALLPAGLVTMALGALGEGLAPTLLLLVLAAALAGAGLGAIDVGVTATAAQLYPERREMALNALNVLFGCGAFLAPLLAGASLLRFNAYLPAYLVTAALLALPALPLCLGLPRRTGGGGSASRLGVRALARLLWAPAAIGFLYLGVEVSFGGWIVAIVQRLDHLSAAAAAPVAALFWLFLALGGAPTGLLLHRGVAPARLIGAGAAGAAIAAALLAITGTALPLAVVAAALCGLALAPIFPLIIAGAGRIAGVASPQAVGSATGFVLVTAQVGAATLPPLQGALLGVGTTPALAFTVIASLLILPIQRIAMRRAA